MSNTTARSVIANTLSTFYDRPAQADEIIAALDAAGFKIVARDYYDDPFWRYVWDSAP